MSATSFIDNAIADAGEYAVYGKALGDKMRAGVQYGPDPRRSLYGEMVANPNKARIAEIDRELAELRAKLDSDDVEEAMGRYKFLYDADPSTLTNYHQQKRTEKMNAEMRKATEAATRESNLQTAWKQNGIDLEVARYDLAAAQNAYNEAKGAGNTDAMKRAMTDVKRAQAKYDRVSRENETLRDKMMTSLGVSLGVEGNDTPEVNDVDEKYANDIAEAEAIKKLDGSLELLDKQIVVDNVNVDKKTKAANVKQWLADIAKAKSDVSESNLSTEQQNARLSKLADMERKVRDYAKSKSKGGQGTTPTTEDYQKTLDGLTTKGQLVAKGYRWLTAAKNAGATHKYLDAAIGTAAGE